MGILEVRMNRERDAHPGRLLADHTPPFPPPPWSANNSTYEADANTDGLLCPHHAELHRPPLSADIRGGLARGNLFANVASVALEMGLPDTDRADCAAALNRNSGKASRRKRIRYVVRDIKGRE